MALFKILKGNQANLPSTHEEGKMYVAIDEPAIYLDTDSSTRVRIANVGTPATPATDTDLGVVKLNSAENITVNSNGQLTVGGRLGQYPNGGGVYYPADINPTDVGSSSFLMTDGAKGISISTRTFAIMAGANVTCKSTAAGSTTYRVSNTQSNRFALAAAVGGRAALNQTDAATNGTAAITSITFANGGNLTVPYFGDTESNNDIIITLDRSINPNASTTQIRVYGKNNTSDNILIGQGVGANGGKVISLGQSTYAGGNQNVSIGNSTYVNANNSVGMGHTMLVNKQYCLGAGQGHDFSSGTNGTTALGTWSEINSKTKLAVGNGTSNGTRSNIFEVQDNSGATELIVKSPNKTKYTISINNNGNLVVNGKEIVDKPFYVTNTTSTSITLAAKKDTVYKYGTLSSLTVSSVEEGIVSIIFTSGSTPTTVTLPQSITLPSDYAIEANKTYEFNIMHGLLSMGVW